MIQLRIAAIGFACMLPLAAGTITPPLTGIGDVGVFHDLFASGQEHGNVHGRHH
jgi:hypothetical protein